MPRQFLRINEPGVAVFVEIVQSALNACETAARELAEVIGRDLVPLIETSNAEQQTRKVNRCHLEHDQRNNSRSGSDTSPQPSPSVCKPRA